MIKKALVGLTLCGALAGACHASPMTDGEVRLYNFEAGSLPFSPNGIGFAGWAANLPDYLSIEFFDGLNLTGGSLGPSYIMDATAAHLQLAGVLDGVFSMRVTAHGTSAAIGDVGELEVMFQGDYRSAGIRSTAAIDGRTATPTGTVPEPGSLLLVALAGMAFGATRLRKAR